MQSLAAARCRRGLGQIFVLLSFTGCLFRLPVFRADHLRWCRWALLVGNWHTKGATVQWTIACAAEGTHVTGLHTCHLELLLFFFFALASQISIFDFDIDLELLLFYFFALASQISELRLGLFLPACRLCGKPSKPSKRSMHPKWQKINKNK